MHEKYTSLPTSTLNAPSSSHACLAWWGTGQWLWQPHGGLHRGLSQICADRNNYSCGLGWIRACVVLTTLTALPLGLSLWCRDWGAKLEWTVMGTVTTHIPFFAPGFPDVQQVLWTLFHKSLVCDRGEQSRHWLVCNGKH